MELQLKKAHRGKAFIKIGMSAPSGGGKTYSALRLAKGLMEEKHPELTDEEQWEKIAIIDTENNSGQLYADTDINGIHIGEYLSITLDPPFEADKYTAAIDLCKKGGIEVCIIDSTTHLWSGEGGLLEQQNNTAKRSGNSYTAWRDITPQHNRFVASMLQTPMHIIATMRAKQEYAQEKDNNSGKATVRKLGLEPEQRKGMEYEFTIFFEIDSEHMAKGAKDRTGIFDQKFLKIDEEAGRKIMKWLEGGTDVTSPVIAETTKADGAKGIEAVQKQIIALCTELGGKKNPELMTLLEKYTPTHNPNAIKDQKQLSDLYVELQDMVAQKPETLQMQPRDAVQTQEVPA